MKTIFSKMRRTLSMMLCMALVVSALTVPSKTVKAANTSFSLTAQQTVDDMGVGWNLGNSLDASVGRGTNETSWGNPWTTKAMIDEVKKAGFRTIRIPATWTYHMGNAPDYTIETAWLDRVEEVVKWALDDDMYVILNTHHEGGNIIPNYANRDRCSAMITKIWTQIANRFEKYGNNLIFETLNEPRVEGGTNEWNGATAEVRDVLNTYNQTALDAIRATGGNNRLRKVMIPTVAASTSDAALNDLKIPNDNNVIVSVHAYSPYNFAMQPNGGTSVYNDQGGTDWQMQNLYNRFVSKGHPVIIGEWGSINRNNLDERIKHARYYVASARKKGITCVWWDNNNNGVGEETFGIFNRRNLSWNYPGLVEAMVQSEVAEANRSPEPVTEPQETDWILYDNNGSAVKESADVIRVNSIGAENWQPHYYKENLIAEQGQAYYVTGTLKSSIDRTVTVHMQIPDNNYETLFTEDITLKANEAKDVKIYVPAQTERKTGIKLTVCMGSINGETNYPSHTIEVKNAAVTATSDTPQSATEAPQPVTDAPQPVTEAPQPVTDAPQPITDAPQPVTEAPQPVTDAPQPVTDEPQPVTDVPQPVTETNSTPAVETTKNPNEQAEWTPADLSYTALPCNDNPNLNIAYAMPVNTMTGLVPEYLDNGNTLQFAYADPNAEGSSAQILVNGQNPGEALTLQGNGIVKIDPTKLPDNAYTVITIQTATEGELAFVVKKGDPSVIPTTSQIIEVSVTDVQTTTAPQTTSGGQNQTGFVGPTTQPGTDAVQPTNQPEVPTTAEPGTGNAEPTTEVPTTVAPTTQAETLAGEAKNTEEKILALNNDNDPAGADFKTLRAQVKKSTKSSNKVSWKKLSKATKYVVYGAKCGTKYTRLGITSAASFTQKNLVKGTYYKYMVVAVNDDGQVLAISRVIHSATKGGKVGNAKTVKLGKKKVTLKKGKKFKVKAAQTVNIKNAKIKNHRKISFESSNTKVATVSKKGVIKAKSKGKCTVFVFAQNGVYKKITVKVKG